MAQNDPWSQYAVPTAQPAQNQPVQSQSSDPWAQYAAPQQAQPSVKIPSSNSDPWSQYATGSTNSNSGSLIPERDESDRFTQEDPNANWLEKAWTFANKPLTESILGWGQYRPGAGGVERFAEKTLSGLSSPLSLLMTAAFLPAGIAEGVAGSTLKEGLVEGADFLGGEALSGPEAALKVEQYAKAVNAAKKAQVSGQSIEDAVSGATNNNMPYQEFKNFGAYLRNQGLHETDMLGESFARRGISQGLAKAGVTADTALKVAKGAETLVNAGFGIQAVHGAMYAYPHALDQLENGDYDGAAESILTAGADTIFGALGLAHGIHSVQDLVPGVNEKSNLALSDEIERFKQIFKTPEGDVAGTQFKIDDRRRSQMAEMFEVAGLPDYAEKFRNIPSTEKFRWDKELVDALNNVVSNKDKSEALANKQMQFFAALDSGNKRSLASTKISALIHAYKLEEWAKFQNLPIGIRDERTIQTIANEEANNVLLSGTQIKEANQRIKTYGEQIDGLSEELKQAPQPQQEAIRNEISRLQNLRSGEQISLPELEEEYNRNKIWTKAAPRFAQYQVWINRLEDEIKSDPDNAPLAVQNQNRIQALRDRIAREYEPLYKEKYNELNRKLDEAAKDIVPTGPGDRNALDEFNKKLRISGVNPQDIFTIEQSFPHFRLPESSEDLYRDEGGPFYLKSSQVLRDKVQGPQQGSAVLKTLQNNGVKADELYWTGLDKFLEENKDRKISPQELQDHLAKNRVEFVEVGHGEPFGANPHIKVTADQARQAVAEGKPIYWTLKDDPQGPMQIHGDPELFIRALEKDPGAGDLYQGDINDVPKAALPLRYSQYTYPGGKNNREVLITSPSVTPPVIKNKVEFKTTENYKGEPVYKGLLPTGDEAIIHHNPGFPWRLDLPYGQSRGGFKTAEEAMEALNSDPHYVPQPERASYLSSHWNVPNVLAHVRMNDRVLPDGRRLLHVEELQSDWHQEGRERGYKRPVDQKKLDELHDAFGHALNERNNYVKEVYPNVSFNIPLEAQKRLIEALKKDHPSLEDIHAQILADKILYENLRTETPEQLAVVNDYKKYRELLDKVESARSAYEAERKAGTVGVPEAPFKKTWPELLIKRLVHYAAENGYDGVSWTPGEEQINRYPTLADIADEVTYDPKTSTLRTFKSGYANRTETVPQEKLAQYIGKEPAKRLLESKPEPKETIYQPTLAEVEQWSKEAKGEVSRDLFELSMGMDNTGSSLGELMKQAEEDPEIESLHPDTIKFILDKIGERKTIKSSEEVHRISGEKLNVGGEGMRGFYDKIVPDIFNTIGKKFGTKVDKTTIGESPNWTPEEKNLIDEYNVLRNESLKAIKEYNDAWGSSLKAPDRFKAREKRDAAYLDENTFIKNNTELIQKLRKSEQEKPLDVQYLPINEKLRDSVTQEGFPLFNREFPVPLTEAQKQEGINRLQKIEKQIADVTDKLKDFPSGDDRLKLVNKRIKLLLEQSRLSYLNKRGLPTDYVGEVRKLPDGTRLLYVPNTSLQKIQAAIHKKSLPLGEHIPAQTVRYILQQLKAKKNPDNDLIDLVERSTNPKGQIVLSRTPVSHGGSFDNRLHTIREELIHKWQGELANTVAQNHLRDEHYNRLYKQIPEGMQEYLTNHKYTSKPTRVLEAAAKMMAARDLSTIGVTPEEAAKFLHSYFTEIKSLHGDNAFDNLVHTTRFARKLKEDFVNAYRSTEPEPEPEPVPRPEPIERPLAGMGAGGGGGPAQPPSGGNGPEEPFEHDPDWRKKFPPSTINGGDTKGFGIEPWMHGPQDAALPDNLSELLEKARGKNFSPAQIKYVQKYINALAYVASGKMTPRELELYKTLRKADDDNWTVGYNKGIIHSIVDNHIHHIWGEDKKRGYANIQRAASGAFSINASQARHRSWGTAFEGILQGRQLAVHDPVNIIAHDANNIAVAASHRDIVDRLTGTNKLRVDGKKVKNNFERLKASDGRPMVVFTGRGSEVPEEDGSPSSLLVNPNTVRNILMEPHEIQELEKAGLLDRYIKDGEITDRTPHVDQGNVKEWIQNTESSLNRLINQNPLLANPKDHPTHIAGWGQLQNFAQEQAGKIAAYLGKALDEIKNNPQNGKYITRDLADKPQDFNMAESLSKTLHGLTGRTVLTPGDLSKLEQYRARNENYSNGFRGDGKGPMSPADVARLALQEQKHLDPELTEYLDKTHDLFSTDKNGNVIRNNGNWTQTGLSQAMWNIYHAAENEDYPRIIQDLSDLRYVDKNLTSANPITREEHKQESMQRLEDINNRQKRELLWSPSGYISIDHPAFTDWKWMANINGKSVLAQSEAKVHPEVYDYLVNRLGLKRSALREDTGLGKVTGPLLKAGAQAKNIILSGSPFHIIQEALRAVMLGVNPLVRPNPISNIDEVFNTVKGPKKLVRLGIENSLTVFNNRFMAEDASIGVASHFSKDGLAYKIPVVSHYAKFADQIHDLLFNRLIPSYKVSAFKNMFDKYASAHPDWSDDAISYAAAQHVNNAFGGINWREMGRSATTQDWFHLLALAPDWLESEMRFAAGLFKGVGIGPAKYDPNSGKNFTQQQVALVAAGLWTSARVLNLLYSGNAHYETPFGLATKGKDGREIEFSVRTMPTDILHMASDPMGFLNGRMSPLLRTEEEIRTGRNQYGQKLTPGEKYVDMVSNLVPIFGQAKLKEWTHLATSADVPGYAQIAKAAGATAQVYRTPAQKTAANLAAERSEEGSMNPAKIARHRLLLQLEDDLRSGRIKNDDLEHMVAYGNLPIADAKNVIKNVQETAGEDPETARLYSRVSRLDFAGAEAVWNDANPSEKKVLEKLIVKKANAYLKKSMTDFTPDERAKDPMFKRARQLAPLLEREVSQ